MARPRDAGQQPWEEPRRTFGVEVTPMYAIQLHGDCVRQAARHPETGQAYKRSSEIKATVDARLQDVCQANTQRIVDPLVWDVQAHGSLTMVKVAGEKHRRLLLTVDPALLSDVYDEDNIVSAMVQLALLGGFLLPGEEVQHRVLMQKVPCLLPVDPGVVVFPPVVHESGEMDTPRPGRSRPY